MKHLTLKFNIMKTLTVSEYNELKVLALKSINICKWVGNTIHDNIDFCLTAINLESNNSGFYKPKAIRIKGLLGIYMLNEDGSLFCEARIIKLENNKYKIEYLSNDGWQCFENKLITLLEENTAD